MDLRPYSPSAAQIAQCVTILKYQPFRISDAVLTGVGHSWMYEADRKGFWHPQFMFDSKNDSADRWRDGLDACERLSRTYSSFVDAIVRTCPGGSYLDLCCNTGYMPVLAFLRGMRETVGSDAGDFSGAMSLLNEITGAKAKFVRSAFDIEKRCFAPPWAQQFDVVSSMAYLLHVPEPLHFLRIVAGLSRHSVLLWSTFTRNDEKIIRYSLTNEFLDLAFPFGFDAGVGISDTLLIFSMRELGFPNYFEIVPEPDGWPVEWDNPLMKPYQPLRAFMFTRG